MDGTQLGSWMEQIHSPVSHVQHVFAFAPMLHSREAAHGFAVPHGNPHGIARVQVVRGAPTRGKFHPQPRGFFARLFANDTHPSVASGHQLSRVRAIPRFR